MNMKSKGKIKVQFDSTAAAGSAEKALEQEKGFERARVKIARKNEVLEIGIFADDVVAFRAAFNSVLRNMQVFESIEKDI